MSDAHHHGDHVTSDPHHHGDCVTSDPHHHGDCVTSDPHHHSVTSDPPAPPPGGASVAGRMHRQTRRPRAPPPGRPPRPAVKQKGQSAASSHTPDQSAAISPDQSTSHTVSNQLYGVVTNCSKVKNGAKSQANGRVLTAKPPVHNGKSRTGVSKPLVTSRRGVLPNSNPRPTSPCERVQLAGYPEITQSFGDGADSHLSSLRLRKGSLDDDVLSRSKPVVQYVEISPHTADKGTLQRSHSKSVDELDRYNILLDLSDIPGDYFYDRAFRSSFLEAATLKRQTIGFHSDVQTLLKHSKDEPIYSLPQAQTYSESTLRAVAVITNKYDTLQRRRLHAASFREGDLARLRGTLTLHRDLARTEGATEPEPSPLVQALVRAQQDADVVCRASGLGRRDIARLETFYSGAHTEVVVCACVAGFYLGSVLAGGAVEWSPRVTSGVPVWVLDTGRGRVRRRELHVYLADRVTGFPLWRDRVNYMTNVEICDEPGVLSLRLSSSLSRMARLRIACADAAETFVDRYVDMTADPNDDLWRVSTAADRRPHKRRRRRRLTTRDVSQPCNVQHVARVEPGQVEGFCTVAEIMQGQDGAKPRRPHNNNTS